MAMLDSSHEAWAVHGPAYVSSMLDPIYGLTAHLQGAPDAAMQRYEGAWKHANSFNFPPITLCCFASLLAAQQGDTDALKSWLTRYTEHMAGHSNLGGLDALLQPLVTQHTPELAAAFDRTTTTDNTWAERMARALDALSLIHI